MNFTDQKILIAYYSRPGQNYRSGQIVDLKVGNTEVVARIIHQKVGGELFPIETVKAYPRDYTETTKVAQAEYRAQARPPITGTVEDFASYDVIFLGYPNWWGTAPMPVFTFLEGHDFSGKILVPFCTHEGSALGQSERDLARVCPQAQILPGLALYGSSVDSAQKDIQTWLGINGLVRP